MNKFDEMRMQNKENCDQLVLDANRLSIISQESYRVADVANRAGDIITDIDKQFAEKTKLNCKDIAFLFTALILQCLRQYALTPFDERVSADEASKKAKIKNNHKSSENIKMYYVPTSVILSNNKVPYDIVAGSNKFNLGGEEGKGLSGNSHRFRTLGHDPILGYIFGTANILTNTITISDFKASSYHIKYEKNSIGSEIPTIASNAETAEVFKHVKDRFENDRNAIKAAIIKQYYHIKSDKSKAGLPIPFTSWISPEISQQLAELGIDAITMDQIGKQAKWSIIINFFISIIHNLMYDKTKDGALDLYKVRTEKIINYSNLIASGSNLIIVGIGSAIGIASNNPKTIKSSLRKLDVGGLIVTIFKLFSSISFIQSIKQEFIMNEFKNMVNNKDYDFMKEDT